MSVSVPRSARLVFLGNDTWSAPSLRALAATGLEIALVVTRVPRPAGRGGNLRPTPIAEEARRSRLPLLEVETVRSGPGLEALRSARPAVLVVVAYGEILPPEVLRIPRVGAVNLHFSLLPELRGASPVQTALLRGLKRSGVTTMLIDEGLDTGPILAQAEEPIRESDDAGSLGARLAEVGAALLSETVERLLAGDLVPTPQIDALASLAPKLSSEDRWLDWSEHAEALVGRVRALSPEPGASTRFRGEVLKIFRASALDRAASPGEIVAVGKDGFEVGAGRGILRPLEVAPAGRKRMSAAEFVRGYRPREGESLG